MRDSYKFIDAVQRLTASALDDIARTNEWPSGLSKGDIRDRISEAYGEDPTRLFLDLLKDDLLALLRTIGENQDDRFGLTALHELRKDELEALAHRVFVEEANLAASRGTPLLANLRTKALPNEPA